MSDLQICKRIAEIEGVKAFEYDHIVFGKTLCREMTVSGLAPQPYNPLTDDALNHQLMIKYRITVEFTRYYEHLKSITTKAFYDDKADNGYGAYIRDISTNKAILLAIIEAHKDNNNE